MSFPTSIVALWKIRDLYLCMNTYVCNTLVESGQRQIPIPESPRPWQAPFALGRSYTRSRAEFATNNHHQSALHTNGTAVDIEVETRFYKLQWMFYWLCGGKNRPVRTSVCERSDVSGSVFRLLQYLFTVQYNAQYTSGYINLRAKRKDSRKLNSKFFRKPATNSWKTVFFLIFETITMNLNQHLLVFIVTVWLLVMNSVDAVRVGTKKKGEWRQLLHQSRL